jgi:hypothetical protein
MNGHQKQSRRRQVLPVWTYVQAQQASPYICSILRSLRDHRLEQIRHELRAKRLAAQPGRPDRMTLIAHEEAVREARSAAESVEADLRELQGMGVYCQHAIRGQALLPFVQGQLLAWLIFDAFEQEPLRAWRYHSDPENICRPIREVAAGDWSIVV